MARWMHLTFCAIWLVTALVFFILGVDAQDSENTKLVRFEMPATNAVMVVGNFNPVKILDSISKTMDANTERLEDSIHHTARLSFWLDFISFAAALAGFLSQAMAYVREHGEAHKRHKRKAPSKALAKPEPTS